MGTDKEKVLLIDDDEMNLRLVDGILDGTEFELFKTVDASEGIKIAKISKPKVILLDIMMPKYDGFMICKILKRSSETKNIPVIFLTAKKSKEDLVQAIKSGGSDYIVKPFSATDLLTKLRKIAGSIKGENVQTKNEKKTDTKDTEAQPEDTISNYQEVFPISFNKFNDVMVISTSVDSIIMANCQFLSNAFSTIVSDGIFKVVFDISEIKRIDGAGLALLISINETLKDYDGELHITFPNIDLNSCFSVIKLNYLFKTYESLQEAIESFQNPETESYEKPDIDYLSICKSCTYMNLPKARYCSFCGTNLMLGKGERIFEVLGNSIYRNLFSGSSATDVKEINATRNLKADHYKIPQEFNVELITDNIKVIYKSSKTDSKDFKEKKQIAIEAPFSNDEMLKLCPGISVRLKNSQLERYSEFDTQIIYVDEKRGMISVHYTEDAKILHSKKYFSVAPLQPVPINLMVPSIQSSDELFNGKILELNSVRMMVFSEENIPINKCLAVNFTLPDGDLISTPLVIIQKSKEKLIFGIEFVMIDEKERAKIIQYMYKRQIEMVKQHS